MVVEWERVIETLQDPERVAKILHDLKRASPSAAS